MIVVTLFSRNLSQRVFRITEMSFLRMLKENLATFERHDPRHRRPSQPFTIHQIDLKHLYGGAPSAWFFFFHKTLLCNKLFLLFRKFLESRPKQDLKLAESFISYQKWLFETPEIWLQAAWSVFIPTLLWRKMLGS